MKTRSELWATLVLIPIVLLAVYPFVWMFFSSFKSNNEIYKPTQLLPQDHSFDLQYVDQLLSWHKDEADLLKAQAAAIRSRTQSLAYDSEAFAALIEQADVIEGQALAVKRDDLFDFRTAFCNSLLIAVLQAFGAVVLCASVGFVFGKYSFKGKTCLLGVALLTILIPRQVIALPLSEWLIQLQLYDSLWAIILPGTVTGIGLLFFAKMFRQVPEELLEVARTEGASELRVFFTVLPLVKSSLLTFAFIQFTMAWHEHLMPLLMLESDNETLPLALSSLLSSSLRFPRAVVMAGGFFMIVPTILLFIFLYRQIKSSLSELILH